MIRVLQWSAVSTCCRSFYDRTPAIELREYSSYVIAEVTVQADDLKEANSKGFKQVGIKKEIYRIALRPSKLAMQHWHCILTFSNVDPLSLWYLISVVLELAYFFLLAGYKVLTKPEKTCLSGVSTQAQAQEVCSSFGSVQGFCLLIHVTLNGLWIVCHKAKTQKAASYLHHIWHHS